MFPLGSPGGPTMALRNSRRGRYATLKQRLATAKLTLEGVSELCMPEYVAGTSWRWVKKNLTEDFMTFWDQKNDAI